MGDECSDGLKFKDPRVLVLAVELPGCGGHGGGGGGG